MAEPIIGTAASAIDRLDALLGDSEGTGDNVNLTNTGGDGKRYHASAQERREGKGGLACTVCTVCSKPGHVHVAKDCLVFMEMEGVCKRWFMHDVMHSVKWEGMRISKPLTHEHTSTKGPRRHPRRCLQLQLGRQLCATLRRREHCPPSSFCLTWWRCSGAARIWQLYADQHD